MVGIDEQQKKARLAVEAAYARRAALHDLEVLRLFDGEGDGLAGVRVDRFAAVAVVRVHEGTRGAQEAVIAGIIEAVKTFPFCRGILLWRHSGDAADTTRGGAECVYGEVPEEFTLREHGLSYLIRPYATPSAGFFIDMREVRERLIHSSAGKRVLNTFCFTGSLGLAAWRGGAHEVVQVDISKSVLTWARCSAELNQGAAAGEIRYIPEDTYTFLTREVRRVERGKPLYQTIVIDPPVFGSSKGVRFIQAEDLGELVRLATRLLAPGGELYLTSNRSGVTAADLSLLVERAAQGWGRQLLEATRISPPLEDFMLQSGEPTGAAAAAAIGSNAMRGIRTVVS